MRHWSNPWPEARDVQLEDIIALLIAHDPDPSSAGARARQVRTWLDQYEKLDPYILPSPSGWHALGARYGNEGAAYLSFTVDKGAALDALLAKSTPAP